MYNGNYIHVHGNSVRTLVLVDFGAGVSCVSSEILRRLHLQPTPFGLNEVTHLSAADGYSLTPIGTVDLTITIQGLKIPHKFHVVENLNYNVIWGVLCLNAPTPILTSRIITTFSLCDDLVIEHLVHTYLVCVHYSFQIKLHDTSPVRSNPSGHQQQSKRRSIFTPTPFLSRKRFPSPRSIVN